ncbi:MAG: hypothetical protein ACFFDF_13555 [Candidatus Odinarchaeota archaeon]
MIILAKLKPSIRETIIIYGTASIITILSIIFFSFRGYPLVTTVTETLNVFTPPLYMIPIFFPYGILIGEVIWLWNEQKDRSTYILLFIECLIIAIISFIRYIIPIPFSGHAIILIFYLFHQVVNNRFNNPIRLLIGIIVLTITIVYKIYIWNDLITFLLGALLGIVLWLPGFLFRLKIIKKYDIGAHI